MALQVYAKLIVKVDGALLQEQQGVTIEDHVNRPCRMTIASAVPEAGAEFDARKRIGETIRVSVHMLKRSYPTEAGDALLDIDARIVSVELSDSTAGECCLSFTCEHVEAKSE